MVAATESTSSAVSSGGHVASAGAPPAFQAPAGACVGIIAGNGRYPLLVIERLKALGYRVVVVAHRGESLPEVAEAASTCTWVRVGQLGKIIKALKRSGAHFVAMAGGISRIKLFGGARPDWRAVRLIARLGTVRDDVLLRGIAEELAGEGLEVFSAVQVLDRSLAEPGVLTRRGLTSEERNDALIGWEASKGIGKLDIGQTVVAYQGVVIAVEAVDGTDATIRRAGVIAGTASGAVRSGLWGASKSGPVVVKTCKPQQDERLDLPTVGELTVRSLKDGGIRALVIEAGRTLILDRDSVIAQMNAAGIACVAVESASDLKA